jgi:hypothetical protein
MKSLVFIVCIYFAPNLFAQIDTNCISTRWIAVKNDEHNRDLFKEWRTAETDLLYVIRELTIENKLEIYNENRGYYNSTNWYPIPYVKHHIDSSTMDTLYSEFKSEYFEFIVQSDTPLTDEYGDPKVVTYPDGTQSYVYPPPRVYQLLTHKLLEIRIKEELLLDSITNQRNFVATGISFYYGDEQKGRELFWVNLQELYNALDDKKKYKWYEMLKKRRYSGFQYMQVPCSDNLIRY